MNWPASINTFIILSLTLIISSCGGGGTKLSKNTFSVNALASEEHPISNDERNIATRICYAYQSKSKNYRSSGYLGTNFLFSVKNTDCQNSVTNFQINSFLKYNLNNDLIYATPGYVDQNIRFYTKIQTDTSGYLSQVCGKILTNQVISNTINQQDVKVQISFFHDELDGYGLSYFNRQNDNSFKIDSAEKLKVRSQIDFVTGQILGMDEYYSTQKVCTGPGDKTSFSNFEQRFISH